MKTRSRECFWCKQETLAWDPVGHEKYPCVCLNCGMRVSEEIPWWKDEWHEILAAVAGVGIFIYGMIGPVPAPWVRILCIVVVFMFVGYIISRRIE